MPLLQTTTAEGASKGMVTARAPHELQDQEVAYLQDAIINQAGFVSRRGAITGTTAITAANLDSSRPIAIATVYDPSGVQKVGIFYWKDTGAAIQLWVSVYTTALVFVQKHFIFAANSYPNKWWSLQVTPAIDGSLLISLRYNFTRDPVVGNWQTTTKWHGGCPTTSITSLTSLTATVAATEGSTSVTGAVGEIAKISFPGLIISGTGVVASVTSTTQVELVYPSPRTYAATSTQIYFTESLVAMRARGRVSCTAGVLTGITGYGTKFTEATDRATTTPSDGFQIWDQATMKLLSNFTVGTSPLAVSDTLTSAPTTVFRSASMKNYLLTGNGVKYAGPNTSGTYTPKLARGSFFATYKGYMISFNATATPSSSDDAGDLNVTSRAYVHGPRFPEIMDHSAADGDWFEVGATKGGDQYGVAVVAGSDAVVLCKVQESYALTGDNPDNFSMAKISDDGALSFESVANWRGKAIWAGRTGIWMYSSDMAEPEDILVNTIGPLWKSMAANFSINGTGVDSDGQRVNQAKCFVYKDYLFVNVMNCVDINGTGISTVYTDGVARTQNPMQLMIYMPTRAVSMLTNFNFQGFVQIGNEGYVLLPQLGSTTHHLFPMSNLFQQGVATVDTILTINSYNSGSVPTSVGPWFHMESRAFDIGDGLLKKNWKQLAIESKMTSGKKMFLETVAGLNVTGVRAALPFTGTGSFLAARVKFRTRDQYMRFRLYEDINNRPSTLTLGAWQWAFKPARRGAV